MDSHGSQLVSCQVRKYEKVKVCSNTSCTILHPSEVILPLQYDCSIAPLQAERCFFSASIADSALTETQQLHNLHNKKAPQSTACTRDHS